MYWLQRRGPVPTVGRARNIDNAFHVLHQKFTDVSASAVVQLHGNGDARLPSGGLSVSDGRITANPRASPHSCDQYSDTHPGALAEALSTTVQPRPTFSVAPAACRAATRTMPRPVATAGVCPGRHRFLHLEQKSGEPSLIDQPQPVIDALRATIECSGSCSLPAQVIPNSPRECTERP